MGTFIKIIRDEDYECDGCISEFKDREGKPCLSCNRNYQLYSDRYVPFDSDSEDADLDNEDDCKSYVFPNNVDEYGDDTEPSDY